MAFLMFALLAVFVIIAYLADGRDLLSPWFLLCLVLLATYSIVLINYGNWEVKINLNFIIYILTAIISFGFGTLLVKCFSNNRVKAVVNKTANNDLLQNKLQRRYPVNIFMAISIVFAFLYIFKLLGDAGEAPSFSAKLRNIYNKIIYENYSPGFIFNQFREIVTAIAYLNIYRIFIKIYAKKDTVSFSKLLIPIIVFVALVAVSSDRNIFLRFAFFSICLFVLFYRVNYKKKNPNAAIVRIVICLLIVIVLIFFLLGRMKQYSSNIFRSLSIYGGSGLYNFNLWIQDFNEPLMYGKSTFSTFINTINSLFQSFGISFGETIDISRFEPFIEYTSSNGYVYSSNIYSALKPYVEDFGYLGVIIFPFIIGVIFQRLFIAAKRNNFGFGWLLYCLLIYPIVFFPIAEQLFRRLHFGLIYEIGWLTILYFAVYGKKKFFKKRKAVTLTG